MSHQQEVIWKQISHIAADLTESQRLELERLVQDLVDASLAITEFEQRLLKQGQIDE